MWILTRMKVPSPTRHHQPATKPKSTRFVSLQLGVKKFRGPWYPADACYVTRRTSTTLCAVSSAKMPPAAACAFGATCDPNIIPAAPCVVQEIPKVRTP